jgi:hypothetical protein
VSGRVRLAFGAALLFACSCHPTPIAAPTVVVPAAPAPARSEELPSRGAACDSSLPGGADEPAPPQEGAPEVARVKIVGFRRARYDVLSKLLTTTAGQPLDGARIRRDIRRLWATCWFDDIQVARADVEGGVEITFVLQERRP